MPSGAKKRKAAKKKKEKGGPNPPNNDTNYPSSKHLQGDDDSKSQDDRESDTGSPLSQENYDHEHHFDEENDASEKNDTPSVALDLNGSKLGSAEDPAVGNIVVEDEKRFEVEKEVNVLGSGTVDGSVASERKQEEDPSFALSSEPSSGIEEKALQSLAEVASNILEVEKAVEDDNSGLRVESVPTEATTFEQVMPLVEVDKTRESSVSDGNEEKAIEDAYAGQSDELSFDIKEKNDDLDTPVVPMANMVNPVIDSVNSEEPLEMVEWRLSDNEEFQERSKVNGTLPTVKGLDANEVQIFPVEANNVETSLDESKALTSANEEGDEAFPSVEGKGKTVLDGVDAVTEYEDKVLIVTEEKDDAPIPVGADMIESSIVGAAETVNETKTKIPVTGSVDDISMVEASDVVSKRSGVMLPISDSGTVKAAIDQENKKDSSVSAGTQAPVAHPSRVWAFFMSCCGLSEVFGVSNR